LQAADILVVIYISGDAWNRLRAGLASNASTAGSGTSSAPSSVSRTLGAELLSKLTDGGGWLDDEDEGDSAETLRALGIEGGGDDTEDENIVQTIITRTKKVGPLVMTNFSLFLTFCSVASVRLIRTNHSP
jgi:hypothetical protein